MLDEALADFPGDECKSIVEMPGCILRLLTSFLCIIKVRMIIIVY